MVPKIVERGGEGTDVVLSAMTVTLPVNVENLTLTDSDAIDGTGNASANTMIGNDAANRMFGMAGNDTLTGGGGSDTLDGGAGNDTLVGGIGNDLYVVDTAGDRVIEKLSEGTDTVEASVSFSLSGNIENLVLTGTDAIGGTGNVLNNQVSGNDAANRLNGGDGTDTLIGNAGNDTLNGGTGNDSMAGGTGNDTYYVDVYGDKVIEMRARAPTPCSPARATSSPPTSRS